MIISGFALIASLIPNIRQTDSAPQDKNYLFFYYFLITLVILIYTFIKVKKSTILFIDENLISITYPFTFHQPPAEIHWQEIIKIELDNSNDCLYIFTRDDIFEIDNLLWRAKNNELNNNIKESSLYLNIKKYYNNIQDNETISKNAYQNNLREKNNYRIPIITLPFFIFSCFTLENIYLTLTLKNSEIIEWFLLIFSLSFFIYFLTFFFRLKNRRYIYRMSFKSAILAIYTTGIIVVSLHIYSLQNIKPTLETYSLKSDSTMNQIWTSVGNTPEIIIQKYKYKDKKFIYSEIGKTHSFHVIHGLLNYYDVPKSDIDALFTKKITNSTKNE